MLQHFFTGLFLIPLIISLSPLLCRYERALPSSSEPAASLHRDTGVGAGVDHHLSGGRPVPGACRTRSRNRWQGQLSRGR